MAAVSAASVGRALAGTPIDDLAQESGVTVLQSSERLDGDWHHLMDLLTVSPHLTVVHIPDGAIPVALRRSCAAILPWGVVDPGLRRIRWEAVGGTGEPPMAASMAELVATAAARILAAAGYRDEGPTRGLP